MKSCLMPVVTRAAYRRQLPVAGIQDFGTIANRTRSKFRLSSPGRATLDEAKIRRGKTRKKARYIIRKNRGINSYRVSRPGKRIFSYGTTLTNAKRQKRLLLGIMFKNIKN